jgi:hypothetical protein
MSDSDLLHQLGKALTAYVLADELRCLEMDCNRFDYENTVVTPDNECGKCDDGIVNFGRYFPAKAALVALKIAEEAL